MNTPQPQLIYEGSVKNVYRDPMARQQLAQGVNYFDFTDAYSVFDWGRMPDAIAHKGHALAIMGGRLFEHMTPPQAWQALESAEALTRFDAGFRARLFNDATAASLKQAGLRHHFLGWADSAFQPLSPDNLAAHADAPRLKVRALSVTRPIAFTLDQNTLYEYDRLGHHEESASLIPLEVVFRFGMTAGSSLAARLEENPPYYAQLGLSKPPQFETLFERPVIEFFTKLESTDRYLTPQEAFLISGLPQAQFMALYDTALMISLWLYDFFARRNIQLWDGKLEFGLGENGVMLVDSIGPDELRLTYEGIQLSKEVLRHFYRNTPWEKATREAKALAACSPGTDWRALCETQLCQSPAPFTPEQKHIADSLYGALVNYCFDTPYISTDLDFNALINLLKQPQPVGAA